MSRSDTGPGSRGGPSSREPNRPATRRGLRSRAWLARPDHSQSDPTPPAGPEEVPGQEVPDE